MKLAFIFCLALLFHVQIQEVNENSAWAEQWERPCFIQEGTVSGALEYDCFLEIHYKWTQCVTFMCPFDESIFTLVFWLIRLLRWGTAGPAVRGRRWCKRRVWLYLLRTQDAEAVAGHSQPTMLTSAFIRVSSFDWKCLACISNVCTMFVGIVPFLIATWFWRGTKFDECSEICTEVGVIHHLQFKLN